MAKNDHFSPLSESPPARRENFELKKLAQKDSCVALLRLRYKISMKEYHLGGSKWLNKRFFHLFPYTFLCRIDENRKSRFVAPSLPLSMPIFRFSQPSRHSWR